MPFRRLIAILVFLTACSARGWNSTGHEIVAQIAWEDLTPAAREKITAILKSHPHYARHLASAPDEAKSPDDPMHVFMRAATWPDIVRMSRDKGQGAYHHPEWHYINTPLIPDGSDPSKYELPPLGDKLEPGKSPQNILQAIQWSIEQLKNPDVPPADKAIALAWLEHLVGDIHQPLHTTAVFSAVYPTGDRGGNLFIIKYHGNITNLHLFWDEILGGYSAFDILSSISGKIKTANPRASFEKQLKSTKFADWSAEGFALARDIAYDGGKLKGVTREASVADKGATTPELPDAYVETSRDTAKRQAALAGYRLADLLNQIFQQPF